MESLKNQVLEALIVRTSEEQYQKMLKPEYKSILKSSVKSFFDSLLEGLGEGLGEDIKPNKEEMSEIETLMEEQFSNPAALRESAYKQARSHWGTREGLSAQLGQFYKELEKASVEPEVIQEFKKLNEGCYSFLDNQNKIVEALVKIAEKEGIEKAVTRESQYKVTREIFPTEDEYVDYKLKGLKSMKQYLKQAQNIMMKDGIAGKMLGKVFGGVEKAFEGMQEKLENDLIYEEAKKIYSL